MNRKLLLALAPFAGLICLAGCAQPAHQTGSSRPEWKVVETARDNGHLLTPLDAPVPKTNGAPDAITCDPSQVCQEIEGFGGALTESSAWVLAQLPPERRAEVIKRYFDPQSGLGYTVCRTHINSCDFSLKTWSLDDTPGDMELHDFSLAPMRQWLLPLIRDAHAAAGPNFHLLASPWSPPAWMKTNGEMAHGGSLRPECRDAWAKFYVRYVEAMKAEGIPVWALTVQNEPAASQPWESCLYSGAEERDFVRDHLGPALANAGLTNLHLLIWDHNRGPLYARASAVYEDPAAAQYVWGTAVHWYLSEDFSQEARVHDRFPDKHLLFTEGCWEGGAKPGRWDRGERYARNMIGDFQNWVCGWIDWNIALDISGGPNHTHNLCDSPVLVDTKTGEVRYQTSFYYIGQFSKFVKPGAHRIVSTGGPATVKSVAFINPDQRLIVVVLNEKDAPVDFTLSVPGQALACHIPAHAIQTYLGPQP